MENVYLQVLVAAKKHRTCEVDEEAEKIILVLLKDRNISFNCK